MSCLFPLWMYPRKAIAFEVWNSVRRVQVSIDEVIHRAETHSPIDLFGETWRTTSRIYLIPNDRTINADSTLICCRSMTSTILKATYTSALSLLSIASFFQFQRTCSTPYSARTRRSEILFVLDSRKYPCILFDHRRNRFSSFELLNFFRFFI